MSGDLRVVFFEAEDFFKVSGEVVNVRVRVDNLQETAHSSADERCSESWCSSAAGRS